LHKSLVLHWTPLGQVELYSIGHQGIEGVREPIVCSQQRIAIS